MGDKKSVRGQVCLTMASLDPTTRPCVAASVNLHGTSPWYPRSFTQRLRLVEFGQACKALFDINLQTLDSLEFLEEHYRHSFINWLISASNTSFLVRPICRKRIRPCLSINIVTGSNESSTLKAPAVLLSPITWV